MRLVSYTYHYPNGLPSAAVNEDVLQDDKFIDRSGTRYTHATSRWENVDAWFDPQGRPIDVRELPWVVAELRAGGAGHPQRSRPKRHVAPRIGQWTTARQ